MAQKGSTLINMTVTLLVITAISSASLAFMYQLTREPTETAAQAKQDFAIRRVLNEYDNDPSANSYEIDSFDGGEKLTCFPATLDGKLTGTAVRTWTTNGFSGLVRLMTGFDSSGNIIGISVLEQKETPGLGTKMADLEFRDQFAGKNPGTNNLAVRKDGGEVDAITAATISSRAFSDAVNRAYKSLKAAGRLE